MPRHPDPDLEERVLKAADALWRRGGERALTMRAVARAAGTNTPALYRRFKNRDHLIKGLNLRFAGRIRQHLEQEETLEKMAEAYVQYAIRMPNQYSLFYKHGELMSPRRGRGAAAPVGLALVCRLLNVLAAFLVGGFRPPFFISVTNKIAG